MSHHLHTAVLREALRLNVPAAMRAASSQEDTTIGGGKYVIEKGVSIVANAWTIQRDPKVWGDNVSMVTSNACQRFYPEQSTLGRRI